ncbi:hypothetical protein GCM10009785_00640 [Brooklawnia cerclae]|uniref:Uncharacterized protein n=1 Tax=Brooklawnia cerclae TaxID=349934 RepID=A0ABX0SD80_9ACTN|nr:hypothetical protein [Brooklawnia cerclae]NIH56342.1 hypothetical protein [Brooklawnia cerclae]
MARLLVCVPVDREQARVIASGLDLPGPLPVFTVTPELLGTFGLEASDTEEAEYAALLLASIYALARHGERLVLTAQVDDGLLDAGFEQTNGGRLLRELRAPSVEAWFADDGDAPVAGAAAAAAGLELDAAWETPEVADLLAGHDLLWHSIVELGRD